MAGFFHKILGGGNLLSGMIFGPRQGQSQMGELALIVHLKWFAIYTF